MHSKLIFDFLPAEEGWGRGGGGGVWNVITDPVRGQYKNLTPISWLMY